MAHHAAVLEAGRIALTGTGAGLLNDPEVARLYLGAGASGTMGAAVAASHAISNAKHTIVVTAARVSEPIRLSRFAAPRSSPGP